MSLQAILDRIQAAGEAQAAEIRQKAEQEAQAILREAREQAEAAYQAAYREATASVETERARILNQARFDALCLTGKAYEEMVEAALAGVSAQLAEYRGCADYPALLERILEELLPGKDGSKPLEERIILEADPRDQELLETILRRRGLALRVDYRLSCWGGLNAYAPDGAFRLVNTLESRLEQALPYLRQQLMAWFAQETAGEAAPQPQEIEHGRV